MRQLNLAFLSLLIAGVSWGAGPVYIRLLHTEYDPYTLSFMRYVCASIPLLVLAAGWFRRDLLRAFRMTRTLVPLAAVVVIMQCAWTIGCYGSTALVSQLITKLSAVFIILLSFVFFREERSVIRNPAFLLGTLVSFVGVALVIGVNAAVFAGLDRASILLIATAVLWAGYVVWAKHLVNGIHPIPLFAVVCLYVTLAFVPISMIAGEGLGAVFPLSGKIALLTIGSGVMPIAMGHTCYHYAQKYLGAALSSTLSLFVPLITFAVSSVALPQETMRPSQFLGGGLLILGMFAVTLASNRWARFRRNRPVNPVRYCSSR